MTLYNNGPLQRVQVILRINWRNWALPLAFGGGLWEDFEYGDYGQRYAGDMFRAFYIQFLCFVLRVEWMVEE